MTTTYTTTQCTTTPATVCMASQSADIAIVIDSSASVGLTNFRKMLAFIGDLVNSFTVSRKETQVGLVTFDSSTRLQFQLDAYDNKNDLLTAISNISYILGGHTHTGEAIRYVRQTVFQENNGMRVDAAKLAIFITDGKSNGQLNTSSEASSLRDAGVDIIAIGIGNGVNLAELNAMTADPNSSNEIQVLNFDSLAAEMNKLVSVICSVITQSTERPTTTAGTVSSSPDTPETTSATPSNANNRVTSVGSFTMANTVPTSTCFDKHPNCSAFGIPTACTKYSNWAKDNCKKSCNLCDEYCKYQGLYKTQGEEWNDGCGLTCRCEDAANHFYQCTNRCPLYENVPATCSSTHDPGDSTCCTMPACPVVGSNTQSIKGYIVSFGRPWDTDNSILSNTKYANSCIYKGQVYQEGQTWTDGCEFSCECVNGAGGIYNCTQRCQRYASTPPNCQLTQDPNDVCCQVLSCTETVHLCTDKVEICATYGHSVCYGSLRYWAIDYCAKFCGYCTAG